MNLVELFAGGGGAALGLEAAGFSHGALVESNRWACETLRDNGFFPVEETTVEQYIERLVRRPPKTAIDAVWGSWPCQPFSAAGKRDVGDERNLWPETFRILRLLSPRWFMGENVPGLLQHKNGCDKGCLGPEECPRAYFDRVIVHGLRSLFPFVSWRVLCASDWGIPQHRRRVFLVAGPRPIEWPQPTHGKPTNQGDLFGRQLLPWRPAGEALGLSNVRITQAGVNPRSKGREEERTVIDITHSPAKTIGCSDNFGNRGPWVEPAPTVAAGSRDGTGSAGGRRALAAATGLRRLTAEQCAILQGFPPSHLFTGRPSEIMRQIGNAVPPKLAEVVGLAVIEADIDQSLDLVKGAGLVCSSGGC